MQCKKQCLASLALAEHEDDGFVQFDVASAVMQQLLLGDLIRPSLKLPTIRFNFDIEV
jgi:hypothetical protein